MNVTETSSVIRKATHIRFSQSGLSGLIFSVGNRRLINSISQQNRIVFIIRSPKELKTKLEP